MSVKDVELIQDTDEEPSDDYVKQKKWAWYWSPVYTAVWFLLFYVAVIPSFNSYPKQLLIRDESHHQDQFIGERAQMQLVGLSTIGVKLTGSVENEVRAVNFLLNEIAKIKAASRTDLYDIEVDVQYSSGKFELWGMAVSYHNVSNIVVKLSPKNTQSESYLLVNSHFDSEVGTPAASDAGVMIVIMLETLRVISQSERDLKNPIVFLLNGAEESNMLASHGFITQHKWAPFCKAVINLDSAGAGGRDVLFQSGPNHPWLLKYYKKSVPHPSASTIGEELFQADFIPSDTDFRMFRDHRGVPGLDLAHTYNGYIYHTKYDTFGNMERGTYQTTGDNVLALTWALANAKELENPEAHSEGHTVFYDYLGWFLISYTETTGIVINIVTAVGALITIAVSVHLMTRREGADPASQVYKRFLWIFLVQLGTNIGAVVVPIVIALIVHAMGLPMFWYTNRFTIFGMYVCPIFSTLGFFPALFIQLTAKKTSMKLNETVACFMHSHCICLAIICIVLTAMGIRSAFFIMIAVFFYAISLILNMLSALCCKKNLYLPIHLVCQLLPFWFYTYITYLFLDTFIPMQGRDGPNNKCEFVIAGFTAIVTLLFSGFILPILFKISKSKMFFSVFEALSIFFSIICFTPVGFPYSAELSPQRYYVLHTNRVFHGYDGLVNKTNSGFYLQPIDPRIRAMKRKETLQLAEPKEWIHEECEQELLCGLPLYNTRWMDWKHYARWVSAPPPNIGIPTELKLISKERLTPTKIRYSYTLKSADRAVIYIDPYPNIEITDWSFDRTPLDKNFQKPYFIYHVYSFDDTPLQFWMDVELDSATHEGPALRLGVGAHFLYHTHTYTEEFKNYLKSFPEWTYPTHWTSTFESWIF